VARDAAGVEPLPVLAAAAVPSEGTRCRWLIDGLWSADGVGVIGGAPKGGKTWLALDLAVSVATGTAALGRFPVPQPGPVLLYGAEDAPADLRARLAAIATARGRGLGDLDLGLIVVPSLRLDAARDRARLRATLDRYRPRLLLLDPLVRLHRIDENSAGEMSALLGELRALQRAYQLALVLVHHLRKYAGARGADGQALRGSGDLHAWGDSNLYLRRRDRQLVLTIEHRAAPAPPPCRLELATDPVPHLRVVDAESAADPQAAAGVADQILTALAAAPVPLSRDDLRAALRTRNATLGDALIRLRAEGRIERCPGGFRLRPPAPSAIPVPPPTAQRERNTAS
jgi:hypothetical protein